MVPGGNRALENCLQVETKHQTIQGNYSKIRLLMENTHRREGKKTDAQLNPFRVGTKAFRTIDATSQQASQEDHVAKPSASTKKPSQNFFKENSQSYRLNQNP